jgi:shikimate dehydrogenase
MRAAPWEQHDVALTDAALMANTINQGMHGQPALEISLDQWPKAARERGKPTVNGLGVLLNQARPAFKAWFGVMPEITPELMTKVLATF